MQKSASLINAGATREKDLHAALLHPREIYSSVKPHLLRGVPGRLWGLEPATAPPGGLGGRYREDVATHPCSAAAPLGPSPPPAPHLARRVS